MKPVHLPSLFTAAIFARNARECRAMARQHRDCAREGLTPAANIREARGYEAIARQYEASIRATADAIIAKGV